MARPPSLALPHKGEGKALPQAANSSAGNRIGRLRQDISGGVLVEATVMMTIIFVFVLGGIDFLFAFYQYNAASKAVEMGARIAAVWDPVASGLNGLSAAAINTGGATAGDAMPAFDVKCDGGAQTCTCVSGYCAGIGWNQAGLTAMVSGRGSAAGTCPASTSLYTTGMCQIFNRITPANVVVEYVQPSSPSGLGVAGRPGGPVPVITVSLQNLPFTFYFLGGLLGFADINIPVTSSITGEYMSSAAPS